MSVQSSKATKRHLQFATKNSRVNSQSRFRPTFEPLEERALMAVLQGGDLVVVRVGDGTGVAPGSLLSTGSPVFLDEYTPAGTLVQSIALPTQDSGVPGGNDALILSGTGTSEGELNRSADGRYLTLLGYDVDLPPGETTSLSSNIDPRTIGRLSIDGTVNTSTTVNFPGSPDNARSAVSNDGTSFWATGGKTGIQYATLGASSGTEITADVTGALRDLVISNGQLYASETTAPFSVAQVGVGLPTAAGGSSVTNLTGLPANGNVNGFVMAHLQSGGGTAPDTIYMTNNNTISKFSLVSGSWVSNGSVSGFSNVIGLTGVANPTGGTASVALYATTGGSTSGGGGTIYGYTDSAGYNAAPTAGGVTTIVSLSNTSNEAIRGIALAPNVAPVLDNSVHPALNGILEDVANAANSGTLVSDLIARLGGGKISDAGQTNQGIAVTAVDNSDGAWQFSTNGGAAWTAFGATSSAAARLLASDANTRIRFVPNADFNGAINPAITFRAWDQSAGTNGGVYDTSFNGSFSAFSAATDTATLAITAVNDVPLFNKGSDQSVAANAGAVMVNGWATGISAGPADESGQTLNFTVTGDTNAGLFSVSPAISSSGNLTFTPSGNPGSATITLVLHDNGGTLNGGVDTSGPQTFTITVSSVGANQAPVITAPVPAQTTLEDTTLTYSGGNQISFADADALPADNEQITLTVTGGTASLSGLSGLTGSGNGMVAMSYTGTIAALNAALNGLTFAPDANLNGVASGSLELDVNDLGHNGAGGAHTDTRTLIVNITPVNDAPSFVKGSDQSVAEDSGAHNVANFATSISAGPSDESGQAVNFIVSNDNSALFTSQPSISPAGTLTYQSAPDANGSVTVTVRAHDDGGTANGGVDTSAAQTFVINVTPVDDRPVNTVPGGTLRAIQNIPYAWSSSQLNAIAVSDVDANGSAEQISLTATHGTLTLNGLTGLTGSGNGTSSLTYTGTLADLNVALNGLSFTSTSNFVGAATIQLTTNDLGNTGSGGPLSAVSSVSLNVVAPSPLVINELFANPPGTDVPNDYLEFRSPFTNDYIIPSGTYLITVTGNPFSVTDSQNITTDYPIGTVVDTFDLSGDQTGANGLMVLLQKDNQYVADGLVNANAQVYDNTGLGTGAGWGNNLGFGGSSAPGINHRAVVRSQDVQILHPTATYLLVHANGTYDPFNPAVNPGDDLDSGLTGTLHGSEFDGLTVLDSVGAVENGTGVPGLTGYGYLNFSDSRGTTNVLTPNSQVVPTIGFTPSYIGRSGNTLGSQTLDWVASDHETGAVPEFILGDASTTTPASLAFAPLNTIGSPNFLSNTPPTLITTAADLIYAPSSGAKVIDPGITITDPDSPFYGHATVALQGYVPGDDTLSFVDTPNITGSFDVPTGVLTLTGSDTPADFQAALRTVTYTNTNASGPIQTRTAVFTVSDGVSAVGTRKIRTADLPPVVDPNGTDAGTYTNTWSGSAVSVVDSSNTAHGATITDADDTNLGSFTVSIASPQAHDVLNATASGSVSIAGNGTNTLVFTGGSSLADYQQTLRNTTYTNTTGDEGAGPKTINFTAVDPHGAGSTANSQIVISVAATSTVTNRFLFYKGSSRFDVPGGTNSRPASIPFSDDNAIASDKVALLPGAGAATLNNYSSYDQGINGIMVDLLGGGTHSAITASDFTIKVGNNNSPSTWAAGPTLTTTVRLGMTGAADGAGTVSGSDRVELMWANGAITDKWVEVIVKADANTGLATNDVFFFGNEIGDSGSGNSATSAIVNSADVTDAQTHGASIKNNVPTSNLYDFNKDGLVNSGDVTDAQTHGTSVKTGLVLISIAGGGPFAPDAGTTTSDGGTTTTTDSGVASALAGPSSTVAAPTIPAWAANRLSHLDLNSGPIAKYLEHLADAGTPRAKAILVAADEIADSLGLDDALLDSLLVNLGL